MSTLGERSSGRLSSRSPVDARLHRREVGHGGVAEGREPSARIIDIGDAARHAGREIASGVAQHDHHAAGHVFAAVVAEPLDDRDRAGIAHAEALARDTFEIGLAGDGPIEHGVADDDVRRRIARRLRRLAHDDPAARQAFSDVVVGVADQFQADATGQESSEALAGRAGEPDADGLVGQSLVAIAPGHFTRQHRADRAVEIADRIVQPHRRLALQRLGGVFDQPAIERRLQAMVLALGIPARPRIAGATSCSTRPRSISRAFQCSTAPATSRRSTRPIISCIVLNPRRAMMPRSSSATKKK